jgi:hypothetical protein
LRDLTRRQRRLGLAGLQRRSDIGREWPVAGVHAPYDVNQIFGERVLQQIGGCACLERAINILIALIHCQDDDMGVRVGLSNLADRLETTHGWELKIHESDVWHQTREQLNGSLAVRRRRDDFHVRLAADEQRQAVEHDTVIVDAQDADSLVGARRLGRSRVRA